MKYTPPHTEDTVTKYKRIEKRWLDAQTVKGKTK